MKRVILFLAVAIWLFVAQTANAAFQLQVTLEVNGVRYTIADGSADDTSGATNRIEYDKTVNGYHFMGGITKSNTPGTFSLAIIQNNGANDITGTGVADIRLIASAIGYTSPSSPPDLLADVRSTLDFVDGSTTKYHIDGYVDTTNAFYDGTGSPGVLVASDSKDTTLSTVSNLHGTSSPFDILTTPYTMNYVIYVKT